MRPTTAARTLAVVEALCKSISSMSTTTEGSDKDDAASKRKGESTRALGKL